MTMNNAENSGEVGIWYNGTTARSSEVTRVEKAVRNLGNLTMRVVEDPNEAREIVSAITATDLQQKYPDASQTTIDEHAAFVANIFVRDMQPNAENSQDPLRLIRVESTDGSPVEPRKIYEELKFRVNPASAQAPITGEEVLYTASNPIDPRTILD